MLEEHFISYIIIKYDNNKKYGLCRIPALAGQQLPYWQSLELQFKSTGFCSIAHFYEKSF